MVVIERRLEASQLQDRDYITVAYQLNFSENVRVVWFISMNWAWFVYILYGRWNDRDSFLVWLCCCQTDRRDSKN